MRASKMSQQAEVLASKSDDQRSILGTQMVEGGRQFPNFLKSFSDLQVLTHVHRCVDRNRENKYANQSPKSQIKIVWVQSNYQILLGH